MRYFTTKEFFSEMRDLRSNNDLNIPRAVYLRNLYAFAAKHFCISEKQLEVLQDIATDHGYDFLPTVIKDDFGGDQ